MDTALDFVRSCISKKGAVITGSDSVRDGNGEVEPLIRNNDNEADPGAPAGHTGDDAESAISSNSAGTSFTSLFNC